MKISPLFAMIVYTSIALIIFGFIFLSFGTFSDTTFGGLVMIGPIPIAFGSSPYMTALSMMAGIVLMLLYFMMWKKDGQLKADYPSNNADGDGERMEKSEREGMRRSVRGGGVVMIGPIPIIIGTDSKSVIIVLAIALTILLIKLAFG